MTVLPQSPAEIRRSINEHYFTGPLGPVRYWSSAPQQGLPIVLIHGYGALIEHWKPVMRAIARRHTLYALDLYGFGYSARPAGTPGKVRWAEQVAAFVAEVVGRPAVIVGHSMGGVVATEVARSFPQHTHALVLVNSSGLQNLDRPLSPTDRFLLGLIGAPFFGETMAGLMGNPWGVRQALRQAYHRKERVTPELVATFSGPLRRYGAGSYLAVSRNMEGLTIRLQPGEITVPSLLIWGAEDESLPPAHGEMIQQRMLPQAELRILPDSGHCPFDETPQEFCDVLLPWLNRLPEPAAHAG